MNDEFQQHLIKRANEKDKDRDDQPERLETGKLMRVDTSGFEQEDSIEINRSSIGLDSKYMDSSPERDPNTITNRKENDSLNAELLVVSTSASPASKLKSDVSKMEQCQVMTD